MAVLLTIFFIVHFGLGLIIPYRPGFKPYFYAWVYDAGRDLEKKLNRPLRGPQAVRMRGAVIGLGMAVFAVIVGVAFMLAKYLGSFGPVLQLLFLACCINFMTPFKVVRKISKTLDALPQSIAHLQPYFREPLAGADGHTVIRKTIEFIAASLNRFLMGPLFWLLIGGPVGLTLYVTFSALAQAFGPPDAKRKEFAQFVLAADVLLNIIPAAISALFLTVGALFVSRSNPVRAIKTIVRQGRAFGFYYEGWLFAAIAGGLGVTLGGPVRYHENYAENHLWVGPADSSARLQPADLDRAALLQYIFFILALLLTAALMTAGR